ncbi:MAG TPA: nitrate/sulfonate/bicarbonate ABC transporter ATP-binding protein [Candidatus Binatia bacterium]|nr:nitrate/sulfonate/bicarbonate ABC transporter ATP-binding protein [Candidatus Binatia bacterium]
MTHLEPIIEARGVEQFYIQPGGQRTEILTPTNLSIQPDQIVALLGASGCGKSTLLRILSGLVRPPAGEVLWHGQPLNGKQPNVAIVFQSFALFPWLTVIENVEAPLRARGMGIFERRKRALRILDTVGLDGFETAYPKELSGGMKQRVGFARGLVVEPEVLFMDEPFSALDVLTSETLRGELLELWTSRRIPTRAIFMVTHNIEEAVELADRIVVLAHRPASIRDDFLVELPQPRTHTMPRFHELVDHIYKLLTQPEEKHVLPAAAPAAGAAAPKEHVALPHARPGGIAGLVEIIGDRGGRDDLYHLAEDLVLDVEDLLPIVEAARLLGFAEVSEGDVRLTPTGKTYAEASIEQRKQIFREAALERIPLLRQIHTALRAKSDHAMPAEFFRDILDDRFSADEAPRQMETAMDWGRYAEIFDYDSQSDRLLGTET